MIALTINEQALHEKAVEVCLRIKRDEALLIKVLQSIERTKLYKRFQRASLFQYAIHELQLSENVAYCFISVARKARGIASLQNAIQDLRLSVPKASRIVSVLTQKNADELILFATGHSCEKIDREVAKINPKTRSFDKIKFLSEDVVQLTITISVEAFENLKRAEALAAQKGKKFSGRGDVVGLSLAEYVDRHDPVKKAERVTIKKALGKKESAKKSTAPVDTFSSTAEPFAKELCINRVSRSHRVRVSAEQRHAVFRRDEGRCTHIDQKGERCNSDRYLHVHHIIPVTNGGSNDPCNLVTLCSSHHDLVHQLSLPIENQVTWLRSPRVEYFANSV